MIVNMYDAQDTTILLREGVPLTTLICPKNFPLEHARATNELKKTRRFWLRRYWVEGPTPPLFYLTACN